MNRLALFFFRLACLALVLPVLSAAAKAGVPLSDLVTGSTPGLILAFVPGVNLSSVAELFRPDRIATVITSTEAYGTPVLDRFYPEARRRPWNTVLVPIETITDIARAVPVVLRAAPGISLTPGSGALKFIEAFPVKTYDAVGAAEFQNASMAGMMSLQQWADEKTRKHLQTHRLTTEALAAQSLTGTISYPIADRTGSVIELYTINFGTVGAYTVAADWTNSGTTIGQVYTDLLGMRRQMARTGWNGNRVLAGAAVMSALLTKIQAVANDSRTIARQQEDGGIRIVDFVIYAFDGEYYHPGGPSGSPAAGYTKVVGDNEVVLYDPNAPFTLLRVVLDNFKMDSTVPMGAISEITKDGSAIELFFESKPLPVPVPQSMIRTDITDTTP